MWMLEKLQHHAAARPPLGRENPPAVVPFEVFQKMFEEYSNTPNSDKSKGRKDMDSDGWSGFDSILQILPETGCGDDSDVDGSDPESATNAVQYLAKGDKLFDSFLKMNLSNKPASRVRLSKQVRLCHTSVFCSSSCLGISLAFALLVCMSECISASLEMCLFPLFFVPIYLTSLHPGVPHFLHAQRLTKVTAPHFTDSKMRRISAPLGLSAVQLDPMPSQTQGQQDAGAGAASMHTTMQTPFRLENKSRKGASISYMGNTRQPHDKDRRNKGRKASGLRRRHRDREVEWLRAHFLLGSYEWSISSNNTTVKQLPWRSNRQLCSSNPFLYRYHDPSQQRHMNASSSNISTD